MRFLQQTPHERAVSTSAHQQQPRMRDEFGVVTSSADSSPSPCVAGRSRFSHTLRTAQPAVPHAPRPRTAASDVATVAGALLLLSRKMAALDECGVVALGSGGSALLQTIQRGTEHGAPLPQLGSETESALCATSRPLSPCHAWLIATASRFVMMLQTLSSICASRRSIASTSGFEMMHQAPVARTVAAYKSPI